MRGVHGRPTRVISVVVPSYRRAAPLRDCLGGLERQETTPEEIVVVLRTGDEESMEVVRACAIPCVKLVFVDRPGVLEAMQVGVRSSAGDIVAFIDDDAIASPHWLDRIRELMEDDVGAVGGRDCIPLQDGPLTLDVGRVTRWGKVVGNHHLGAGSVRDVHVLKGVNMAIRREALAIPDGLKGTGAQRHFEVATSLHVLRAGWRVLYDPGLTVDHFPADRRDNDARLRPDRAAIRDASYNLVLCLLTFRRGLFGRRALYGLFLGDRGTPGVARAIVSVAMRQPDVLRAVLPSLRGQLDALWEIHRDRPVRMVELSAKPIPDA